MLVTISTILLASVAITSARPHFSKRDVTSLNQAAFAEAHPRDNTATRAFSSIPIKTSNGQCLFVDELSGDFRANLNPIQVANCDGSTGQQWDIITQGVHNNVAGAMLVVNTLTQACMNFDPRKAPGKTVSTFSCGGRADGSGQVTNSQLFPFAGGEGPLSLTPENTPGTCFADTGSVLDEAPCKAGDATQSFTFGAAAAGGAATNGTASSAAASSAPATSAPATSAVASSTATTETTTSVTAPTEVATSPAASTEAATALTDTAAASTEAAATPTQTTTAIATATAAAVAVTTSTAAAGTVAAPPGTKKFNLVCQEV
ncbi:MAG: hypothetical protein M1838_004393 [Thelocarpon superellum]|nr:MAG: hypothetical protein M1838_004393 [Thelocarpon superellum]